LAINGRWTLPIKEISLKTLKKYGVGKWPHFFRVLFKYLSDLLEQPPEILLCFLIEIFKRQVLVLNHIHKIGCHDGAGKVVLFQVFRIGFRNANALVQNIFLEIECGEQVFDVCEFSRID
jgi:hypothetical protein